MLSHIIKAFMDHITRNLLRYLCF